MSDEWRDTACIEWTGTLSHYGYGRGWDRETHTEYLAHRKAWIDTHGPIPPETPCVLHRCDNRRCHNVAHLFLGTKGDNTRDMLSKQRQHNQVKVECPSGHKYTPDNTVVRAGKRQCRTCHAEATALARGGNQNPRVVPCPSGCGRMFSTRTGAGSHNTRVHKRVAA